MNGPNFEEFIMLALVMHGFPLLEVHDGFHAIKILIFPVLLGKCDLDSDLYRGVLLLVRTPDLVWAGAFLRPRAGGCPIHFFPTGR